MRYVTSNLYVGCLVYFRPFHRTHNSYDLYAKDFYLNCVTRKFTKYSSCEFCSSIFQDIHVCIRFWESRIFEE